jgi:starvation-inducible outer membrane lipoprotein
LVGAHEDLLALYEREVTANVGFIVQFDPLYPFMQSINYKPEHVLRSLDAHDEQVPKQWFLGRRDDWVLMEMMRRVNKRANKIFFN